MIAFLIQTLRIAMPYLFAAAGGIVSERAGIIALTLEGFMLTGAFCAALGSYYSGSPWVGILAGIAGGLLAALLHALATIRYRADQVVVGIAINLLAVGVTRFFLRLAFDSSSNSPRVPGFGGAERPERRPVVRWRTRWSGSARHYGRGGVAALPHAVRAARAGGGREAGSGAVRRRRR